MPKRKMRIIDVENERNEADLLPRRATSTRVLICGDSGSRPDFQVWRIRIIENDGEVQVLLQGAIEKEAIYVTMGHHLARLIGQAVSEMADESEAYAAAEKARRKARPRKPKTT